MPAPVLAGRHALVCGASRGIGRSTALALAARGAAITALARSADLLHALLPELRAAGAPSARALVADLDDHDALMEAVGALLAQASPVHVLINNTGGPESGALLDATPAMMMAALQRHLGSAQLLVQACLPAMVEANYGRIVQVLSTSVYEPIDGLGVSNITRAAVAAWAKTLSRELPPAVTINNVLPGFTDTDRLASLAAEVATRTGRTAAEVRESWLRQVPGGRLVHPDETAAAITFLCSPDAASIRGESLSVDGGRRRGI